MFWQTTPLFAKPVSAKNFCKIKNLLCPGLFLVYYGPMLTQELCHSLFRYDNGKLVRKVTTSWAAKAGTEAGCVDGKGYLRVTIFKRGYLIHRVVWFMHHGTWPDMLDHINGDKLDNRIENLRPCNSSQNQQNVEGWASNTSGVKGVDYQKQRKKYRARISVGRSRVTLGRFDTLEEAAKVVQEARTKYHGEFTNHG